MTQSFARAERDRVSCTYTIPTIHRAAALPWGHVTRHSPMTKLCWRATRRTIAPLGAPLPRPAAPHRAAPHRTAPHRTRLNPTTRPNPFHALHSALRLTSMRHMPPFIAKIGEALWRAAYDKLPELCQQRLPNVCVMQTYSRRRGDFVDYHTDSRQTYAGQKIALVSPTVLLALVLVLSALSCLREHPPYGPEPHTKQRKRVQAVGNPPGSPAVVLPKCHTVLRRDHGTNKSTPHRLIIDRECHAQWQGKSAITLQSTKVKTRGPSKGKARRTEET